MNQQDNNPQCIPVELIEEANIAADAYMKNPPAEHNREGCHAAQAKRFGGNIWRDALIQSGRRAAVVAEAECAKGLRVDSPFRKLWRWIHG